jgi:hypothetical protein
MTVATLERDCAHCKGPLPPRAPRHQRYCNASCRTQAYRRRRHEAEVEADPVRAEIARLVDEQTDELRLLARIVGASAGNWRAAAWLLDRNDRLRAEGAQNVRPALDDPLAEFDELHLRRRRRQREVR